MGGDFVSTFRGVLGGNPMDHGEAPKIFQQFYYMLMMDAWNTSYKFLDHLFERDYGPWECMMRANACEGGREGFRGRATEGVWSLTGLVVEPVFRESRLLQHTVMEATGIPQRRRGESSDPMVMKTSDRFHNATEWVRIRRAMILQAIADFRQSFWNLEALAGLDTSETLEPWKTKRGPGRPQKIPLQTTGKRL